MKVLYLAWQDPTNHRWYPVGCLTLYNNVYRFVYTKGAEASRNFVPFGRMTNLKVIYESEELFPLFANRLLSPSRPEYQDYLKWLNIRKGGDSPFVILSITGGIRETDLLEVFPCPERNSDGKYEIYFLNHGLRYFSEFAIERVNNLEPGNKLYLMHDIQNFYDSYALALRTQDPPILIGYCPRYLTEDLHKLLKQEHTKLEVFVEKINLDAPIQLRLLCKVISDWPKDFRPCSGEMYEPLADINS